MTHDYKRNGTTDLFAALNIDTGEVITQCRRTHTAVDVLAFCKKIDKSVPRSLDIHVVLDNLSAHQGPEVTEWLVHPRRARWHLHFVPTSSSWLNLVERWFKELTDKRLRRGAFSSVPALIEAIGTWVPSQRRPQAVRVARQRQRDPRKGTPRPQNVVPSQT
jgi:transposase